MEYNNNKSLLCIGNIFQKLKCLQLDLNSCPFRLEPKSNFLDQLGHIKFVTNILSIYLMKVK